MELPQGDSGRVVSRVVGIDCAFEVFRLGVHAYWSKRKEHEDPKQGWQVSGFHVEFFIQAKLFS